MFWQVCQIVCTKHSYYLQTEPLWTDINIFFELIIISESDTGKKDSRLLNLWHVSFSYDFKRPILSQMKGNKEDKTNIKQNCVI